MNFTTIVAAFANPRHDDDMPGPTALAPPLSIPLLLQDDGASQHWHLGVWAFWRAGSNPSSTIGAGRLGGSQVGARLDYDLTPDAPGRLAAYSRLSTALNHPASPEAAIGVAWQPFRKIPITVAAERRIALGQGGRNATALYAAGGFGPAVVGSVLRADGYAQAGIVGLRTGDLFVDGKVSLFTLIDNSPLNLGISLSGGAQPEVSRLDIGPEIHVRLPLPQVTMRIGLEWRERIGGNAAPRSGPTLTLATDF